MEIEKVEGYKVGDKMFNNLSEAENYIEKTNVIGKLNECFGKSRYYGEYRFSSVYEIVDILEAAGMKVVLVENKSDL